MSGQRMVLGVLAVGSALLAACGASDEVWLGRAQLKEGCLEPDCADVATPEESPPSLEPVAPPSAPLPSDEPPVAVSGRCDVAVSGELGFELRLQGPLASLCVPGQFCYSDVFGLMPTAEGGAWVLAHTSNLDPFATNAVLALVRYAADGKVLASARLPGTGYWQERFALDDRGQVWLGPLPGGVAGVRRFDAAAQPIGEPIVLPGGSDALAALPGQGVLVLGRGVSGGTVTLFDYDGQQVWSRASPATREAKLGTRSDGFVILHEGARGSYAGPVAVDAFDTLGNPRWNELSMITMGAGYFSNYLESAFDSQGNLLLAMTPQSVMGSWGLDGLVDLESIDASGQSRWALRLPSALNLATAIDAKGQVFVAESRTRSGEGGRIAVIAQDGQSCRRYSYADVGMLDDLMFGPDGRLWFISNENELGRFAPISP